MLRRVGWTILLIPLVVISLTLRTPPQASPRIAVGTFNVARFPRTESQAPAIINELEAMDVPVIAVQNVVDGARLIREMRIRLGYRWGWVSHPVAGQTLHPRRPHARQTAGGRQAAGRQSRRYRNRGSG